MLTFGLGVVAGGALIWFCKEKVLSIYKTTEDRIGELNDQIAKLKAKL